MKAVRILLLTATMLLSSSCSENPVAPCSACTFDASIERTSNAPPSLGGVSLTVRHLGDYKVDRSVVHVAPSARIYVGTPRGFIRGSIQDLLPGRVASFTITDAELRSDPRQVFATAIELLPLMPNTDQSSSTR